MAVLAPPHAPGTAFLGFTRRGLGTVLSRAFAASPVQMIATHGGQSACWVYAATLGGGLVGGDQIRLHVDVAEGARALLTTQASTKVYRSLRPAGQSVVATVDAEGLLVVLPDPIVCFAAADFTQSQRYELHGTASLVLVDWMTSGRHAAGERWAFSRYESRLTVSRDSRPILNDAIVLERDADTLAERMGRFDVLLTAILSGPLASDAGEALVRHAAQAPIVKHADLILSASKLGDGSTLLRMAGTDTERVGRTLRNFLAFLTPLLGDDPWSRKW